MDTSKTYVKMCGKATEIQEDRDEDNWQDGDFWTSIFDIDKGKVFVACTSKDAWTDLPLYKKHRIETIWLPRQDQLQEMVRGAPGCDSDFDMVETFFNYVWGKDSPPNQIGSPLKTMEQFWLAFVMEENFSKVWNGEDWVDGK